MTLLSVTKDVCAAVGVLVPTTIFANIAGNRTMQEMLSLANEMSQRIAYDTRDWNRLKATATFIGDGAVTHLPGDPPAGVFRGTTAFNLPADYRRMLLSSNLWRSTSALTPMRFISDTDEWINRRMLNYTEAWGEWTMLGGQMLIWPVMPVGTNATFAYLQRNCVALASGGFGDSFIADGDAYALDERLLKLGMIWQWKASKGTAYAEDIGTYSDALAVIAGHDTPAPILIGRKPMSAGVRIAYPWPVPTP